MKNEITTKEVNGHKVIRVRGQMKSPKIFRDPTKYTRKNKHKGDKKW